MKPVKLFKHSNTMELRADNLKAIALKTLNFETMPGVKQANIFFMKNQFEKFYTSKDLLVIFFGAVPFDKEEVRTVKKDIAIRGSKFSDIEVFEVDDSNREYATKEDIYFFNERLNEIYVPLNIEGLDFELQEAIVQEVLTHIQAIYINEIQYRDSWKHTGRREQLQERITEYLKRDMNQSIRRKEERERELQSGIRDAKERIVRFSRDLELNTKELAGLRNGEVDGLDKFIQGLDDVANHPMVKDVKVEQNQVSIFTKQIVTRARLDGEDQFFDMGDMVIEIDIKTSDVRFKGEKRNRSYWTGRDPHPHVSGDSGRACLGNVETTIAELCAQLEIYALFLTGLDFLQNANPEDTAGKNVVNWERVNEDGTPFVDDVQDEVEVEEEMEAPSPQVQAVVAPTAPTTNIEHVAISVGEYEIRPRTEVDDIATYVAYDNYIGYIHNDFLEEAEEILRNGGNI